MSHNNPNFPQQPFSRAAAGRQIDDPADNWSTSSRAQGNMGMPTMGMPSMGGGMPSLNQNPNQRQVSPMVQLEALSRQIGLDNDYGARTTTNNDYSSVNEFLNGSGGGDVDMIKLKTEEAKGVVSQIPPQLMSEFQHRQGRYSYFDVAINEFAHKFTNPAPCQTVFKFRELINTSMRFRQNIGFNVGVVLASNLAQSIVNDEPINPQQTNKLLLGCLDNVIAMELIKWLSANNAARDQLFGEGPVGQVFRNRLTEQHAARRDAVNDMFAYLGLSSPYEGLEAKLSIVMDHSSDPTRYAHNPVVHGYVPPSLNYGDVGSEMSGKTLNDQEMLDYNRHLESMLLNTKPSAPEPVSRRDQYEEFQPTIVFGESNAPSTDLSTMTASNHNSFDWMSKLVPVPKTQLWTTDNETLAYLRNTFFGGRFDRLRTAEGCLTVFTLNVEGTPNEDDRIIDLNGRPMETFLTNPSLLLPLLEETANGIVEIEDVKVVIDEEEQYNLEALRTAAMGTTNVRNTLIEDFASSDLEAYDREAEIVHSSGRRGGVVHATTNVETHYQSVIVGAYEDVRDIYRTMGMIVKGEEQNLSYFDWLKMTYTTLGNHHIEKADFLAMADKYIASELERHMVERYGFSNDPSDHRSFNMPSLVSDCLNLDELIQEMCPEAYEELSTPKTSRTLIAKSQCLLPHVDGLTLMSKNVRAKSRIANLENYNASIRVCFAREVIVTRISNMVAPVQRVEETVAVIKRSEMPDFFSVISYAYSKASARLHDGVEQLVIFTDVNNGRWSFQTNRYDGGNVGTIRRLKQGVSNLTVLPLEMTHRL